MTSKREPFYRQLTATGEITARRKSPGSNGCGVTLTGYGTSPTL
ncbi:MAG: hypothetical protein ACLRWN_25230 [Eisenbergiella sp.]|nr:hypothetical protein [Eisenbergiella sp. OF01-20]